MELHPGRSCTPPGVSQPALANKLRLLTLTTAQQQLCTAAGLTERHARAVLRLPESRRTAALEKIARDKLSVREADRLVDAMLAAPKDTPAPAAARCRWWGMCGCL